MKDNDQTKKQPVAEVEELRRRVTDLEALEEERKQIEAAVRQYAERQRALYELDRAITASLRLTDIYHAFTRHAIGLLPYDHTSITLLEGEEVRLTYVAGEEEDVPPMRTRLTDRTSSVSRVVIQGQPVVRHNIVEETQHGQDEFMATRGIRSSMILPMRVKGRIIGTWNIGSHQVGAFSPDDMELAQSMADQLGAAVENARLYERAQREIKQRREAEKALRESKERFRQVIVSVSDHIYMAVFEEATTGKARPVSYYISPNVESLVGYSVEKFEADWDFWRSLIHPDDQAIARLRLDQFPVGGNSQVEYRLSRADGNVIWVRDSRQLVVEANDPDGLKRMTLYGVVSDITGRKQLEEQLYHSQKMEAIGRLAGGIAHDFNNLLTVITGYSELLLYRHLAESDPVRRNVEQIMKAGERASSLTRQLLAFGRKQVLQPEIINLNDVVSRMDQMLRRLIGEDIELVTELETGLGQIKADPGQMDQVIMNLAINARDAMPRGGKLTIKTENVDLDETDTRRREGLKPGLYVMLALSDNGQGMDAATKARIFEPFFTTKQQGQGTGLGLATVYGIVSQSDGHIRVYSEPGQGATFKIYLPRIGESVETSGQARTPAQPPRGSETVLLVEDEDMVRQLAQDILTNEGYTVLEAADGLEALQMCKQYTSPIHLLITDIVMPGGINGPELVEQALSLRPELKVFYISGYTGSAAAQRELFDPDTAFLEKPFTPKMLAGKVREVLDKA